jgi:CTP-dependent riboflavin kinase
MEIVMSKQRALTGKIVSGVRQGAFFTQLDWFQEQCQEKLGFKPYPGTLNIKISTDKIPEIEVLENDKGLEFIPPDATFCSGKTFPVSIAGVRGAIIMPAAEVRVHGKDIVEVIAPINLKGTLGVADGDSITLVFDDIEQH